MTTGHRITVEPGERHVRVVRDGRVLAESDRALVLHETGCPARWYIPPEDVRLDLLTPSATHTYCPFKGTASYWSLPDAPDLVWSYPDPKPHGGVDQGPPVLLRRGRGLTAPRGT